MPATTPLHRVTVVHNAITAYRSMDARHRVTLNLHADDDGNVPHHRVAAYDEDRFTCALEAAERLDAVMSVLTEVFGLPTDRPVTVLRQWHHTFQVTPGRLDDTARKAFTNGQCHALALALAETTGWPATALLTTECFGGVDSLCSDDGDDQGPCRIGHIVVTRPDGTHVDTTSAHSPGIVPDHQDADASR